MNLRRFKIFVISRSVLSDGVSDCRPRNQTDNREGKQNRQYNQAAKGVFACLVGHSANELAESAKPEESRSDTEQMSIGHGTGVPDFVGKRPLPLGEGWGEGVAE